MGYQRKYLLEARQMELGTELWSGTRNENLFGRAAKSPRTEGQHRGGPHYRSANPRADLSVCHARGAGRPPTARMVRRLLKKPAGSPAWCPRPIDHQDADDPASRPLLEVALEGQPPALFLSGVKYSLIRPLGAPDGPLPLSTQDPDIRATTFR